MNATPRRDGEPKLLADRPALLLTGSHKGFGHAGTEFLYIEGVHHRAETITPLLKAILDFRPPPHWN